MSVPLVQTRREEIVESLIRVHGLQLVKRLTRILRQSAAAQEVAQDTYERLLQWDQLEATSPEARKAVLSTAGYRLAINRIKHAKTAERADVVLAAAAHADPPFESLAQSERIVMAQQAIQRLTEVVDSLPERLREPMVPRYVEELPRRAICARLGIAEDNLDQRIREARAFCRNEMASVGFDWLWLD